MEKKKRLKLDASNMKRGETWGKPRHRGENRGIILDEYAETLNDAENKNSKTILRKLRPKLHVNKK